MMLASFKKACYKAYTSPVKLNWAGLAIDICSQEYFLNVYINDKLKLISGDYENIAKYVNYEIQEYNKGGSI